MGFLNTQNAFINYIRDPNSALPQGTDKRHMAVYRELFFNNIEGFISNAFPVLKSLYNEKNWLALINQFFSKHDCQTPIFNEISEEFLYFLQNVYQPKDSDPAFLLELAHYEWIELYVALIKETPSQSQIENQIDENNIAKPFFCLSNAAKVVQYSFDVQNISDKYQPTEPLDTPTFFCVYRDTEDEVQFLKLNPLAAHLLSFIENENAVKWSNLLLWLTKSFPQIERDILQQGSMKLIAEMARKGVVRHKLTSISQ